MTDKEVFEYHGWREQCKHITSEMHELTSAIQEYEILKDSFKIAYRCKVYDNICEELEDMDFMLNQIREYYLIDKEQSKHWGDYKRKRESKRIKEGYYEKKK